MSKILGHHHLSMITADVNKLNNFMESILGLRRVKITVNQDSPSMYHLFYGDSKGSPGTELTFFEILRSKRSQAGSNSISLISLLVLNEASLKYWQDRLETFEIDYEISQEDGQTELKFTDFEGLSYKIVSANGIYDTAWETWEDSPVPSEHQIIGLGPVEISVKRPGKLQNLLEEIFDYKVISKTRDKIICQANIGERFGEIIIKADNRLSEIAGRGSVHHIALRVKDESALYEYEAKLKARGLHTSEIIDRFYFKSLYFRESNGILFELATDGPGFLVDSKFEDLGKTLHLPPFLEKNRSEIEALLSKLDFK